MGVCVCVTLSRVWDKKLYEVIAGEDVNKLHYQ